MSYMKSKTHILSLDSSDNNDDDDSRDNSETEKVKIKKNLKT